MNSGEARGKVEEPQITVIGAGVKVENGGDLNESEKIIRLRMQNSIFCRRIPVVQGDTAKDISFYTGRHHPGWNRTCKNLCKETIRRRSL